MFCTEFLEMSLPIPNKEEVILVSVGNFELSKSLEFRLRRYGFENVVVID